jgi:dolichol kinase
LNALAADQLDLELTAFGAELHAFLDTLPELLKRGRIAQLRADCAALLDRAPDAAGERWARVKAALTELRQALHRAGAGEAAPAPSAAPLDHESARAYLFARYQEAARAYEQWLAARRTQPGSAGIASLKPLMGARTWFHIAMGATATLLYELLLDRRQAMLVLGSLLLVFGTLEVTRRLSARWNRFLVDTLFKSIARPHEFHQVNSATWYLLALSLLAPFFSRPAVLSGVLVLAFGDPAAAWIGRSFGRVKLRGKKSLEGSLGFVAVGALVVAGYLLVFHPEIALWRRLLAAGLSSVLGAVAELFSERVDDNLTVPIVGTLAAALLL